MWTARGIGPRGGLSVGGCLVEGATSGGTTGSGAASGRGTSEIFTANAALGVFRRFHVAHFYILFFRSHNCFSFCWVSFSWVVIWAALGRAGFTRPTEIASCSLERGATLRRAACRGPASRGATRGRTTGSRASGASGAAFGVFVGFEVTNFHFFFLSHNCLSLSFVCGLVDVSRTEEQLTAARDVSFWDEVIKLDQLFLIS